MKKLPFYIIFFIIGIYSCTEFLSPDVSEETIEVISPSDALFTSDSVLTFWWEENEDAENYRFQLVSPDFDNPSLIFDTLMLDNLLSLALAEGRYIWRVKIENEGSESAYQSRDFVLDQSMPLIAEALQPESGGMLNMNAQFLSWQSGDKPIDRERFAVSDSIYLYSTGANPCLISSTFLDFEDEKRWDISEFNLGLGKTYEWEIVSIDRAGNKNQSARLTFTLN